MSGIIDFSKCEQSDRAGTYGGKAGRKDGIIYQNEYWMIKYPKTTKGMRTAELSYTTAPLSEYIGSHIYQILGFDVHQTELGFRQGKIVVGCKDFCKNEGALREVRTLKNLANEELGEILDRDFSSTNDSHFVNLEETLLHLQYNPILSRIPKIEERFWDMVVIDIFINNNDRNNGNWGILKDDSSPAGYYLAPVYDNGAALGNKIGDDRMQQMLQNEARMRQSARSSTTTYNYKDKQLFSADMLQLDFAGLQNALLRNVPVIIQKEADIREMILSIPEEYQGLEVCNVLRKEFYLQYLKIRMQELLLPAYERAKMQ